MTYYHLRDKQNRPVVTVAVEPDGMGGVNRGIAVCSEQDNPSKRRGRELAANRLRRFRANKAPAMGLNLSPTDYERKVLSL